MAKDLKSSGEICCFQNDLPPYQTLCAKNRLFHIFQNMDSGREVHSEKGMNHCIFGTGFSESDRIFSYVRIPCLCS